MTSAPRVTVELLESVGACSEQLTRFADRWPDGVEVTIELCTEQASEWDWEWAIFELLTPEGRRFVCASYENALAPCTCASSDAGQAHAFARAALVHGLVEVDD